MVGRTGSGRGPVALQPLPGDPQRAPRRADRRRSRRRALGRWRHSHLGATRFTRSDQFTVRQEGCSTQRGPAPTTAVIVVGRVNRQRASATSSPHRPPITRCYPAAARWGKGGRRPSRRDAERPSGTGAQPARLSGWGAVAVPRPSGRGAYLQEAWGSLRRTGRRPVLNPSAARGPAGATGHHGAGLPRRRTWIPAGRGFRRRERSRPAGV